MNIFKTYVKRNLKANRLRTTMTILGIILSVALVAAVIEGAFSGIEYARNVLKDTYGNHHGYAMNMTLDTSYELIRKDELEGYSSLNTVGWAEIGSQNSTKPYLLVKEASENIKDFLKIKINEGKFPENENEILIPAHLATNGNVRYNVGDSITLTLSERYSDKVSENPQLSQAEKASIINGIIPEIIQHLDGERLLSEADGFETQEKTYIVCGIMERLPYTIENYMCPGYTAIVKSTGISPKVYKGYEIPEYNVFFRIKDPKNYNTFHNTFEQEHKGVTIIKNRELVAMYGGISTRSVTFFLSTFVAVLIALILFGSISLIYNSFSISINERTKQIGILKSIGATKKQIRKTVFYEALFDCIISIPSGILLGCLGIGITLFLLQEGFVAFLGYFGGFEANDVKIQLVISVPLIIVGVIIVIIAVFLSAAIPALRASSISPIDLVRQNSDIKASGKIKKSKILSKIWGAEGMLASKNYSRNKKRYRSTIVSLSVSIILFISASSFCSYLNSATESELYTGNVDLIFYDYKIDYSENSVWEDTPQTDYADIKEMLQSARDINKVIATDSLYNFELFDPENTENGSFYSQSETAGLFFIDDDSFEKLLASEKISLPQNTDGVMNAVVFNKGTFYSYDIDNNRKEYSYDFIDENEIPKKLKIRWYNENGFPGFTSVTQALDDEGNVYVVYLKDSLVIPFFNMSYSEAMYNRVDQAVNEQLRKFLADPGNRDYMNVINSMDRSDESDGSGNPDDSDNYLSYHDIDSTEEKDRPLTGEELDLIGQCLFIKRTDLSYTYDLNIIGVTYNEDYKFSSEACILLPFSARPEQMSNTIAGTEFYIYSSNSKNSEESITQLLIDNGMDTGGLYNVDTANVGRRMIGKIVSVFSYGFILLISLVAIANVFNTISTNVHLRRREFGMLRSMGLSNKGVSKILNIECLIYGSLSLLIGLPLSIPFTWVLYNITNRAFAVSFSIPWYSVVISVAAVFIVVFVTMLYASGKIKKDNTLDAIRADNI